MKLFASLLLALSAITLSGCYVEPNPYHYDDRGYSYYGDHGYGRGYRHGYEGRPGYYYGHDSYHDHWH